MAFSGLKPVSGADRSAAAKGYAANQPGNGREERDKRQPVPFTKPARTGAGDTADILYERQEHPSAQEYGLTLTEIQALLKIIEGNNRKMKEKAQDLRPARVDTRAAPSLLGQAIAGAAEKLMLAEIKISGIEWEYSDTVPQGHVIRQYPGPGGPIGRTGLRLVISMNRPEQGQ